MIVKTVGCSICGYGFSVPFETEATSFVCDDCVEKMKKPKEDIVNHPNHYNRHPSGVECITITREMNYNRGNATAYVWRAGLKQYDGMTLLESEIYDLNKAIWHLKDELKRINPK